MSGRFALSQHLLARRFKLAAEDLGSALDVLVSILKSEAEIRYTTPSSSKSTPPHIHSALRFTSWQRVEVWLCRTLNCESCVRCDKAPDYIDRRKQ